jgi:hypothetical protein
MIQAGSLELTIDPPDGRFQILSEGGGFDRGEFHCWLVLPDRSTYDDDHRGMALEWVDFSSRHHRRMAERMQLISGVIADLGPVVACRAADPDSRIPWTIPDPPPYIWHSGWTPPDGVALLPDLPTTAAVLHHLRRHRDDFDRLGCLATAPFSAHRTGDDG